MILIVRALSIRATPVTRAALSGGTFEMNVHFPVQQRGNRHLRFRNITKHDFVDDRLVIAMSVAGVLLHDEPLAPHPVFQLVRPGAERELVSRFRAQTIVGSFVGDEALPQAKQQRSIRTLGAQSDGKRVDRLDRNNVGDGARLFAVTVLLDTGE